MRKPNTKHHARFHRDQTIEKWERRVRAKDKRWGVCGQYISPYSGEVSPYNFPERYDWELKGEHNRYNKCDLAFTEYAWFNRHSHHVKYREDRTVWERYMTKNDIGVIFNVRHPWIT